MKIHKIALCVAFVTALIPTIASAKIQGVEVVNNSDKCAWITVYGSDMLSPWMIINVPDWSRPQFLKPGAKHGFTVTWTTGYTEVKVRAELKQTADCGGSTIADVYDVQKPRETEHPIYYTATVGGSAGRYWMKI